ncbi:MAG TPA: hypothetical protein VLZ06_05935, partial [Solirubrobacteraceae bacterium]|nr:hypothetical protein [Solirubrobacteraceae bacterium]
MLLGDAALEAHRDALPAGQAGVFQMKTGAAGPGAAGPGAVVHVYVAAGTAAKTLVVGLYGDAHGKPGELLATATSPVNGGATWVGVQIPPVELSSGRSIWVAILGVGGTLRFRDRWLGPCAEQTSQQISLRGLPAHWRAATVSRRCPASVYVTSLELASPPPAPEPPHTPEPPPAPEPPHTPEPPHSPEPPPAPEPAPEMLTPPSVTGVATEGQTLSASTGTWAGSPTTFSFQWQRCNASGEGCAEVKGASSSTYRLGTADVGHTVRVAVTAGNPHGSTAASSSATTVVLPVAPANVVAPSITGTPTQGERLTASPGTWSGGAASTTYRWEDCNTLGQSCVYIAGATASSYVLAATDVGDTVRAVVTATNAAGAASASSEASGVVEGVQSTGLLVGSTTVQSGADQAAAGTAEAFQYTASASGVVRGISLYVDASSGSSAIVVGLYAASAGNPGALLTSATIASPAKAAWNSVAVTPVPVVGGTTYWLAALAPHGVLGVRDLASGGGPTVSSASGALTALPGTWSSGASWANSPASFYASGEAPAPPPAPVNTIAPTIGGTAEEGQTLTATTGSWSGSPTSFAYEWERCEGSAGSCTAITGAHSATYVLTPADVSHTVRVVVTAEGAGGSASATSGRTAVVGARPTPEGPPVNTTLPAISGAAVVGGSLAVTQGDWSESPTSFAYQWERCVGTSCKAIAGAASSAYRPVAADVGETLRALVTATNASGSTGATSPNTATVSESTGCTATFGPGAGWGVVEGALRSAGARVCLSEGAYSGWSVGAVGPSGLSTLSA